MLRNANRDPSTVVSSGLHGDFIGDSPITAPRGPPRIRGSARVRRRFPACARIRQWPGPSPADDGPPPERRPGHRGFPACARIRRRPGSCPADDGPPPERRQRGVGLPARIIDSVYGAAAGNASRQRPATRAIAFEVSGRRMAIPKPVSGRFRLRGTPRWTGLGIPGIHLRLIRLAWRPGNDISCPKAIALTRHTTHGNGTARVRGVQAGCRKRIERPVPDRYPATRAAPHR